MTQINPQDVAIGADVMWKHLMQAYGSRMSLEEAKDLYGHRDYVLNKIFTLLGQPKDTLDFDEVFKNHPFPRLVVNNVR